MAMGMLLNTDHPEPRPTGWTPELTYRLVEGMQACRWFLAGGFNPPEQFGARLRRCLAEHGLGHSDIYGSTAWNAARAVDRLQEEWQPEWSM
jgi:hypothetical protein